MDGIYPQSTREEKKEKINNWFALSFLRLSFFNSTSLWSIMTHIVLVTVYALVPWHSRRWTLSYASLKWNCKHKIQSAHLKQNFESTKDKQLNKLVEALTKFQLSIPHSGNIFSSAFNGKNLQRIINSLGSDISNSWGDMFVTHLNYPCQHRKLAKTH